MSKPGQIALDFSGKLPAEAQLRKERGMAQADEHADHYWKRILDGAILAVARRLEEFTVDDVLEEIEKIPGHPETHNLSALGPRMKQAWADKIITPTDRVQRSKRPEKHGNRHNVWKSNYYRKASA